MDATRTTTSRATIAIAALAALLGFATVIALGVRDADAKSATVLGKTKKTPKSPCPGDSCRIVVSVTGLQTRADGEKGPFKVPADGHLVAWSVSLGKVNTEEQPDLVDSLNDEYGDAKARLSVLKPKKKHRFKLTKQTPKVSLESRLGETPIYTLRKPLKVKKGLRIGLTMPGWISGFSLGLDRDENQWIASRKDGQCAESQAKDAKPQQKKGSIREYGCRFKGERLLYWAWFVKSGKGGGR
ncbi:MAG TPA: hypothetical protein VFH44_08605 [Solirubrobacterales bacterium]|nr:hypothetical protein [Solirubrobacterales bacterium]